MRNTEDLKRDFTMYCLVGIILDSMRRQGIDKIIGDLRKNCRLSPASNEDVYQDMLQAINHVSEMRESVENKRNMKRE